MVLFSQGLWLDASKMCPCGFGLGVSKSIERNDCVGDGWGDGSLDANLLH